MNKLVHKSVLFCLCMPVCNPAVFGTCEHVRGLTVAQEREEGAGGGWCNLWGYSCDTSVEGREGKIYYFA